ncbi:MAG: DUF1499 domain-containing protein [Planctomycetota bacterium]
MVAWIALGITIAILALIALQIDDWGRDWTQNTAALDESARREGLRPVVLKASPPEAANRIKAWVEQEPNWDFIASEVDEQRGDSTLRLTRTSAVFRFVDDITVTLSETPEGTKVFATSQSRVGKGDLGQNPRNLIEFTSGIRNQAS